MTPKQFRDLRDDLGLTQKQLGNLLGVGYRAIWCYETGRSTIPKAIALACEALMTRAKCTDCGANYADPPSPLCPGCEAYREHQR